MSRDRTNHHRHNSIKKSEHNNNHEHNNEPTIAELIEKGLAGLEIHLDHTLNKLELSMEKRISDKINHKIDKHLHKFEKTLDKELDKEGDSCLEEIANVSSICNATQEVILSTLGAQLTEMDGNIDAIILTLAGLGNQVSLQGIALQSQLDALTTMGEDIAEILLLLNA